ncbi:unnamed protein product [Scytosiphon promiscuus]
MRRPLQIWLGYVLLVSKTQGVGSELASTAMVPGMSESGAANAGDALAPPLALSAATSTAAAAETAKVAAAVVDSAATTARALDSRTLGRRGGVEEHQRREEGETSDTRHRGRQRHRRRPRASPVPTAAAAAATVREGSTTQTPGEQRTLAEVVVTGEGGGGYARSLVPSLCPSDPFERYAALHRDIMDGKLEPRYLVFRPYLYCGMGNRLKGFRGVLGLAMLTDRALLVDWYGGLDASRSATAHKYEDNFLEAHGVPWDTFPPELENNYESLEEEGVANSRVEVWCQMPKAVGLTTPCDESRMTPDFLTGASWDQIYAEEAQVVIVQAHNQNMMDYVRLNEEPSVLRELWKLDWDVRPDVFDTCSLRFLLKPRPDFKNRYCEERSAVLDGLIPSISLHIRTGDNPDYHPEWYETLPQDLDNFLACAAGLQEGLAMVAAEYPTPGVDFDVFSLFKEEAGSVWLLGTDSSTVIDLLTQGNNTVGHGGRVAFVEGDEFYRAHSGSKGGSASNNAGPLIDLALLSEAPLLVGSYCSTFSENAAEIGGLPASLRLFLSTPFRHILGKDHVDWDRFDDFRQGCRDLVSDPSTRDDLRLALRTRLEPWIDCQEGNR